MNYGPAHFHDNPRSYFAKRYGTLAAEIALPAGATLPPSDYVIPGTMPVHTVIEAVSKVTSIPRHVLCSHRRLRYLLPARMAIYYISYKHTDKSFPQIGRAVGGRDHTTVLHGYHKATEKAETVMPIVMAALAEIRGEK